MLSRLREERPMYAVELRPPRANLSHAKSIDTWIDMYHGIRRVVRKDAFVFLTDNAVGRNEEESLHHLQTNLAQDVSPSRLVPIMTCKHSLEYCHMFADRAASSGYEALTVTGGDKTVGAPRCVDRAYMLRKQIRARVPGLTLGGWANPHRDPGAQVGYLLDDEITCEYFLSQVVSHHDMPHVDAFLETAQRRNMTIPGIYGVFYYRSASPKTLGRLGKFLPIPAAQITKEFEAGDSPEEICARSIRKLIEAGVNKIYVSNLPFSTAGKKLTAILDLV
jgi:hypothetical protein